MGPRQPERRADEGGARLEVDAHPTAGPRARSRGSGDGIRHGRRIPSARPGGRPAGRRCDAPRRNHAERPVPVGSNITAPVSPPRRIQRRQIRARVSKSRGRHRAAASQADATRAVAAPTPSRIGARCGERDGPGYGFSSAHQNSSREGRIVSTESHVSRMFEGRPPVMKSTGVLLLTAVAAVAVAEVVKPPGASLSLAEWWENRRAALDGDRPSQPVGVALSSWSQSSVTILWWRGSEVRPTPAADRWELRIADGPWTPAVATVGMTGVLSTWFSRPRRTGHASRSAA